MSRMIKTSNGWKKTSGNVDQSEIDNLKQSLNQLGNNVGILEGQTFKQFHNTIADCNLMTETGTYNRYGQGLINAPADVDTWNIVVFKISNEFIIQFALYWNGDYLYARNKWGGTWGTWKQI